MVSLYRSELSLYNNDVKLHRNWFVLSYCEKVSATDRNCLGPYRMKRKDMLKLDDSKKFK